MGAGGAGSTFIGVLHMDDLPNIAKYGIGGALALLSALALLWYRHRLNREARSDEERAALQAELADARAKWAACEFREDAAGMASEARRIDRLRRRLGLPLLVLMAGLCPACRTPAPPAEPRVVVLSEHCRTAAPGDTVPELPAGETRWWLCTSTGLRLMMPADADIPMEKP